MAINTTPVAGQAISPFDNFFNVTTGTTNIPGISSACWNWCKEQHANNASNLTIEGISIIAFALIVLFIYNLLIKYEPHIQIEGINRTRLKRFINLMPELVIYLLIGFFVWFVWFS